MKNDQIVYLKNTGDKAYTWQHNSVLYTLKKGEVRALPYYLANHALQSHPLSEEFLKILDEAGGTDAALRSMADIATEEAKAAKQRAKDAIAEAELKEKEARQLIAQAKASTKEQTPTKDEPPTSDESPK